MQVKTAGEQEKIAVRNRPITQKTAKQKREKIHRAAGERITRYRAAEPSNAGKRWQNLTQNP